jgi:hypothetical protein
MNAEELNRLLEKYYNGESTEEEERNLREYFNEKNVPKGYETEKEIFRYYMAAGEVPEPSIDFEARILAGIDDASDSNKGSQKTRKLILTYMSAAAGLLILAGSYFFFVHKAEPGDTFTDPEIAYAETIKVLMAVSSQLNHGAQALEPVSKINEMTIKSFEAFNKSTIIIEKNLKNLDYLQKAIEITDVSLGGKINK